MIIYFLNVILVFGFMQDIWKGIFCCRSVVVVIVVVIFNLHQLVLVSTIVWTETWPSRIQIYLEVPIPVYNVEPLSAILIVQDPHSKTGKPKLLCPLLLWGLYVSVPNWRCSLSKSNPVDLTWKIDFAHFFCALQDFYAFILKPPTVWLDL